MYKELQLVVTHCGAFRPHNLHYEQHLPRAITLHHATNSFVNSLNLTLLHELYDL